MTLLFSSLPRTVSPQPWAAAVGGGREEATDRGGDAFQQEAVTFCGTMWHKMNYLTSFISVLILLSFFKCDVRLSSRIYVTKVIDSQEYFSLGAISKVDGKN